MEQRNPSTTQTATPSVAPREAHQRAGDIDKVRNKKTMDFMRRQAESDDHSTFQAGRFFGACEALCMTGIITAKQWQELDDIRAATLEKNGVRHD